MARVSEEIKQHLAEILDREIHNPKIPSMVTVLGVKVSKDLSAADVDVTFLGDEDKQTIATAMEGLQEAAGFIRAELGRRIVLKYLPALKFHYNGSTRYAADIQKVFQRLESSKSDSDEEREPAE
jgi:ribosome-binding factor A